MNPERWEKAKRIFEAALGKSASERAALLAETCAGDPALQSEVESLLQWHAEDPHFIEEPAVAAFVEQDPRGSWIGPYRIEKLLGRGGMGAVFLARRADAEYEKDVAIKLVRDDCLLEGAAQRTERLSRFRTERQVLANLEHPFIAKLLDGGTTEKGLPYLVMEYVKGTPIDRYCEEQQLSLLERVTLFRDVCGAVQYAHQNLVVHRDLKPSNMLVTPYGSPKLLDFGIAKILHPEGEGSAGLTRTSAQPLTIAYASPEQVRGESITTASDIYSLGVVLYELLTGRPPYRVTSFLPHERARAICEEEPVPPSIAVADEGEGRKRLRRQLGGDLDTILLMALRKEPERRYASVEQLSDDIRRYLEHLPVLARKSTTSYRGAKFIRRHRVGVLAATLLLVSLIAGLIGTIWQARQAEEQRLGAESARISESKERERAERKAETASQVSQFLVDLFKVSDPYRLQGITDGVGGEIPVREILERGAERISAELGGEAEVRATLIDAIGRVYQNLGLYDQAENLLDEALALRRESFAGDHLETSDSLDHLGELYRLRGDFERGERCLREALEMRRALYGNEHPYVVHSLNGLATLYKEKQDHQSAVPLFREAMEIERKRLGEEDPAVARLQVNLSAALQAMGQFTEAEELQRKALELFRRTYGDVYFDVAATLSNLGDLLVARGDLPAAEPCFREALAIFEPILGRKHALVARAMSNLAWALMGKGELDQAERLLTESVEIRRELFGSTHPEVAGCLSKLGLLHHARRDLDAAERLLLEALEIERKSLGSEHAETIRTATNLAVVLQAKGDWIGSESVLRDVLAWQRKNLAEGDLALANPLAGLALALLALERPEDALGLLQEALQIREKSLPREHWLVPHTQSMLAECLGALSRFEEAEPLLLQACQALESCSNAPPERREQARGRMVRLYEAWGRPEDAAKFRTSP